MLAGEQPTLLRRCGCAQRWRGGGKGGGWGRRERDGRGERSRGPDLRWGREGIGYSVSPRPAPGGRDRRNSQRSARALMPRRRRRRLQVGDVGRACSASAYVVAAYAFRSARSKKKKIFFFFLFLSGGHAAALVRGGEKKDSIRVDSNPKCLSPGPPISQIGRAHV